MTNNTAHRSTTEWTHKRCVQVGLACVLVTVVHLVWFFATGSICKNAIPEARIESKQLSNMVETYRLVSANGYLPPTLDHLAAGENKLTEEIPLDPWGNNYVYLYARIDQPAFVIFSCGPDGIAGTEDDVFEEDDR